jgi:molybdopterin-guanine dinucleotide biosynthesis protein A
MGSDNSCLVLLLAGGGMPDDLKAASGASKRCLITLDGKTLLERMLDALNVALDSPRIAVNLGANEQGAELLLAFGDGVSYYTCDGGLLDAIIKGLDLLQAEAGRDIGVENVLLVNVDLPLVNATHVKDLVGDAQGLGADAVWPIVEKGIVMKAFPDTKRTWVKTKQGTFTGGNIFLVKPRLIWDNRALLEKAYQNRKNPMAIASLFSPSLIMRLMSGTISVPDLEESFSKKFNAKLRLLIFRHPEVAVDLDKLDDYTLMKGLIKG